MGNIKIRTVIDMTKFNDAVIGALDKWFKNHDNLPKHDFEFIKSICTEVLK